MVFPSDGFQALTRYYDYDPNGIPVTNHYLDLSEGKQFVLGRSIDPSGVINVTSTEGTYTLTLEEEPGLHEVYVNYSIGLVKFNNDETWTDAYLDYTSLGSVPTASGFNQVNQVVEEIQSHLLSGGTPRLDTIESSLSDLTTSAGNTSADLLSHVADTSNPHEVTIGQIGAASVSHITDYDNPHNVTKTQVGLGNVEDTTLSTWAGSSNIGQVGTIVSGVWQGTIVDKSKIDPTFGGTTYLKLDQSNALGDATGGTLVWKAVWSNTAARVVLQPFSGIASYGIEFYGGSYAATAADRGCVVLGGSGWSSQPGRKWVFRDYYNDGGLPEDRFTINMLTGVVSGIWQGAPITDAYINSASTWNAHLVNTNNPHSVTLGQLGGASESDLNDHITWAQSASGVLQAQINNISASGAALPDGGTINDYLRGDQTWQNLSDVINAHEFNNIVVSGVFQDSTNELSLQQMRDAFDVSISSNVIITGGQAIWLTGLEFSVGAAEYYIRGTRYTSETTVIELDTADATYGRFDLIYLDTSGLVGVLTGTPSAQPARPDLDTETQVAVTFIYVPAGATEPEIDQDDIYFEDAEWSFTTNSARVVNDSTNDPYQGSVSVEASGVLKNDWFAFTNISYDTTNTNTLSFYIKPKADWGGKYLNVYWVRNSSIVSQAVEIKNYAYNFNMLNFTYQRITIPMADFGLTSTLVDNLIFQVKGSTGTMGFYVDNVFMQSGEPAPVSQNIWKTIEANSGSVSADNPNDIIKILGDGGLETLITGDTLIVRPSGTTIDEIQSQIDALGDTSLLQNQITDNHNWAIEASGVLQNQINNFDGGTTLHSELTLDDGSNPHGMTLEDIFAAPSGMVQDHINNTNNPHSVTIEQIGAASATDIINNNNWAIDASGVLQSQITNHVAAIDNPHSVTSIQVGLGNVEDTKLSTWQGSANLGMLGTIVSGVWQGTAIDDDHISSATSWNNHLNDTSNPHSVSLEQLGGASTTSLDNISGVLQSQITSVSGNLEAHTIDYNNPHQVTYTQVGAAPESLSTTVANNAAWALEASGILQDQIDSIPAGTTLHSGLTLDDGTNPHGTTLNDLSAASVSDLIDISGVLQSQINTKEPSIASGETTQYWRGDKTWQTLNQAAVAGLTTSDSPTFAGINTNSISVNASGILDNNGSYTRLIGPAGNGTKLITNGSTEALSILSDGRVGIGTNSPSNSLHVYNANVALPPGEGTTAGGMFRIGGGTASNIVMDMGVYNTSPYPAWIQVANETDLSAELPLLIQPSGGYVGIAKTNPATALDVAGAIRASNSVQTYASATEAAYLYSTGLRLYRAGASYIDMRTVGAALYFRTSASADRDTNALIIGSTGAVQVASDINTVAGAYQIASGVRLSADADYTKVSAPAGDGVQLITNATTLALNVLSDGNVSIGGATTHVDQLAIYGNRGISISNHASGANSLYRYSMRPVSANARLDLAYLNDTDTYYKALITATYDGKIGITTTAPATTLHVLANGTAITAPTGSNPAAIFQGTLNSGINTSVFIIGGTNSTMSGLYFGDAAASAYQGGLTYQHSDDTLKIRAGNAVGASLDGSGNLDLVGVYKIGANTVLSADADYTKVSAPASDGIKLITNATTEALTISSAGVVSLSSALPATSGGTGQSSFTKGDLFVATGATAITKIGVGADGTILMADASQASGIKWGSAGGVNGIHLLYVNVSGVAYLGSGGSMDLMKYIVPSGYMTQIGDTLRVITHGTGTDSAINTLRMYLNYPIYSTSTNAKTVDSIWRCETIISRTGPTNLKAFTTYTSIDTTGVVIHDAHLYEDNAFGDVNLQVKMDAIAETPNNVIQNFMSIEYFSLPQGG